MVWIAAGPQSSWPWAASTEGSLGTLPESRYRIGIVDQLIRPVSRLRRAGIRLDRRRVRDERHAQDQPVSRVFPWGEHGLVHAFREPPAVRQVDARVLQTAAHQVPHAIDSARGIVLRRSTLV